MSEFRFLQVYKELANQVARESDLVSLYKDLRGRTEELPALHKLFENSSPDSLDRAIAIDAVAHSIHKNGDETLQVIYPGASVSLAKSVLDELSGMEVKNDIRKTNRGFFTTVQSDGDIVFLEKGNPPDELGRATLSEITDEMDAYAKLFDAGMASKAETLTLSRYDPRNAKYQEAVKALEMADGDPVVVGGPASVEMVDRQGHLITMAALKDAYDKYMQNFRGRNIMALHSDVQVGWPLPVYINENGDVFRSGVDDKKFWLISELRDDTTVARKIAEDVKNGKLKSYSIAGSALDTKNINKGAVPYMQVNQMELQEVTICEQGVNQGANFTLLKSMDSYPNIDTIVDSFLGGEREKLPGYSVVVEKSERPRVVVCSNKRNDIVDSMVFQLMKSLPVGTEVIVADKSSLGDYIPVSKLSLAPVWEERTPDDEPSIDHKDEMDDYESILNKRYENAVPEVSNMSNLDLLKDYLKEYPEREERHKILLEEQGFPEDVDPEEESEENVLAPWIVSTPDDS